MKEMNKLSKERSLYLQQHADNPVCWYPWSDEAFEIAKKTNKPIMLSIGYSACHWCHVMAHESFEDQETADILNTHFINIKVDREERPDVDKIYQMSQSIITGKNGGWPLTIFMDHDKFPFFGGTYFPKEDKYGMLSFKKILTRVIDFYKNNQDDIENQNINVLNVFKNLQSRENEEKIIDQSLINKLKIQLSSIMDTVNGGFGSAPKFPQFPSLSFYVDNYSTELEKSKIQHTLDRMCVSGINDHIDGGFFRYSVDDVWMIPHFEKMLYDNGPMMSILCDSYIEFDDEFYLKKANSIYEWVSKCMTSKEGVFYSTIDADSEGHEGKYYVFTVEEIHQSLTNKDRDLLEKYFLELDKPNFEGNHHLHLKTKKEGDFKNNISDFSETFAKLSTLRKNKRMPNIDKKILLSWNCLYLKGLIKLYKITNNQDIKSTIDKALSFIVNEMVTDESIFSCYNEGACFPGYLDDYALLGSTLIDYLTLDWNEDYYNLCNRICSDLINCFEDKDKGGYFFTSSKHEKLFYRPKSISDDSIPSGLVYATNTLLCMGYISGNDEYIQSADRSLKYIYKSIDENLTSCVSAINLLNNKNIEKEIIIVRTDSEIMNNIKKDVKYYKKYIICIDNKLNNLPDALNSKVSNNEFIAYHCSGMICAEPITSRKDFDKLVNY